MTPILLEACLESLDDARAAEQAGAGRLELCDRLDLGGTTPSRATIEAVVAAVSIPVFPIIRPRGGDFVYSPAEIDTMKRDARMAAEVGAAGIVLGVLRSDHTIDAVRTREVMDAVPDLPATFHLAFEKVPDQTAALETLIEIGMARVLTKGGAVTALDGADAIRALVGRAAGRLTVMAGGSVRESNVAEVVRRSGVREIHSRGLAVAEMLELANAAVSDASRGRASG